MVYPTLFPESCDKCGGYLKKKLCEIIGATKLAENYDSELCRFHKTFPDPRISIYEGDYSLKVEDGKLIFMWNGCLLEYHAGSPTSTCKISGDEEKFVFHGGEADGLLKELLEIIPEEDIRAIVAEHEGLTPNSSNLSLEEFEVIE